MGIDPDDPRRFAVFAAVGCHTRNGTDGHGMVAADDHWKLTLEKRIFNPPGQGLAAADNIVEVLQMWVVAGRALFDPDGNVPRILDPVAEGRDCFQQTSDPDGCRPQIHPSPVGAKIHRKADDLNGFYLPCGHCGKFLSIPGCAAAIDT